MDADLTADRAARRGRQGPASAAEQEPLFLQGLCALSGAEGIAGEERFSASCIMHMMHRAWDLYHSMCTFKVV